jgi:predicted Zn finger-like uncharacterized protein
MTAPGAASLIIVCPHCATRYQLPPEALGQRGRKVQCANCGEAWRANPPSPGRRQGDISPLDPDSEDDLDQNFSREERRAALPSRWAEETRDAERSLADIRAALGSSRPAAAPDKAERLARSRRDNAMRERLAMLHRHLPSSRLRRALRIAIGSVLVIVFAVLTLGRVELVRSFPQLAGAYAAIGLPVNVIGLEFRDVESLVTREDGADVMRVSAMIESTAPGRVVVPPVIVTLLGTRGETLYRWSVTPTARSLEAGERFEFSTRITTPPPGTTTVRLGFAENRPMAAETRTTRPGEAG